SQDAVIQNTNSSAPNNLLVLSLVEQMTHHVAYLNKENQTNKMVNESLTAELERYKERVAIFEQRLNVDLNKHEKLIDSQMDNLIRNRKAKLADFLENSISKQSAPSFDQLFELNELKAQSQEKDMVIKKLKERIKSLSGNMDKDKIKQELEEIETINIELDHRCNGCMLSDNHDLCVLDYINNVNARAKSKSAKKQRKRKVWKPIGKMFTTIRYIWRPTSRTFTIVGNACPLTRITTTTEAPLRKPVVLDNETSKPACNIMSSKLSSGIWTLAAPSI
ncbi:hypothetical protein Tco_0357459, partial [Tanacetum coccineum]